MAKRIVSKKVSTIIQIVVTISGMVMGYFLADLYDGWKLVLAILIMILIGWFVMFKLLPPIYEENKSEDLRTKK